MNLVSISFHDMPGDGAGVVMCRLSKLSARWMGELGFSIGITDVTPADVLNERKDAAIAEGNVECDGFIQAFNQGKLDLMPGCNEIQTLEVRACLFALPPGPIGRPPVPVFRVCTYVRRR